MDYTVLQIVVTAIGALLVGFSKTGMPTLGIFVAAMLASIFPARESVGLLTPILITGDIIAILYYRKTVVWKYLVVLLPWVLAGIVAGYFVLGEISNGQLSVLIGALVLVLIVLFLFQGRLEKAMNFSFSKSRAVNGSLGILAGFTTMIGNAAGSIMSVYLLSKGINKTTFVGTNAYFFFIINLIKVPFTVYLGLITPHSLTLNAWMIPVVAIGALAGFKVLPHIPQKLFQRIVLALAAIGAIYLILE
ncbi:sulfite exporter TauE/SafE family protein [Paenibacillus protaetiae]|uniref:Probable membrane transporter protein n=1 Tax=Paenibacillus protaetiae TaxID=2509456 RepID=A0A4P6EUD3_9BACL|nr:sulfite exporter TauE/SafE family protein [Paenibacillus protaetiae]QAY66572.1 sulfite exporter TauE/SafE family protein [Paenibacillus protaetiae]